ncbi:hypothetical protein CT19431_MP130058 [Cupriavidus taiwanensis]|nr:hypothetical protein CT19431_MP130058 [Cupriavidus taiwanensis]
MASASCQRRDRVRQNGANKGALRDLLWCVALFGGICPMLGSFGGAIQANRPGPAKCGAWQVRTAGEIAR